MLASCYLIVNPLITLRSTFWCTPAKPIGSLTLARGVIMEGWHPKRGGLMPCSQRGHWLCDKTLSKLIHRNTYYHMITWKPCCLKDTGNERTWFLIFFPIWEEHECSWTNKSDLIFCSMIKFLISKIFSVLSLVISNTTCIYLCNDEHGC